MQTPESMDATGSAQAQEAAPEQSLELSPSLRGRQRKKNSKFLDYEVSEVYDAQTPPRKRAKRTAASPNAQTNTAAEEEHEGDVPQDENSPKETPKKSGRGRKKGKKTAGRKTPAKVSAAEGAGGEAQSETPRPKRKYTKKVKEVVVLETGQETGAAEATDEGLEETPGARPRRGAARAALKYLHSLAKDVYQTNEEQQTEANGDCEAPTPRSTAQKTPKANKGRGRKRKRRDFSSDAEEDEDFVPNAEDDEEEEDLEEDEDEVPEELERKLSSTTPRAWYGAFKMNGLTAGTLNAIKVSTQTTRKFREQHHSSWVFPDWIPSSSDWQRVSQSEVEGYLPEERQSAAFAVSREGLKKEEPQRLDRFRSIPSHPDRWDSLFFCGGPVWALEWCPTPDQTEAAQFVALSCHRTMDEQHRVNQVYSGPGLVQIWDLGTLKYDTRADSQPALVYGLAQDRGFVWQLKWCPSGAWEPPDTHRQAPSLPRLGLLAVASSLGLVTVYSLPHPDALLKNLPDTEASSEPPPPPVFKARAVVTLKLGSFKAPRFFDSGQVLSLDWLPQKPHNVIAIGFYDGHVGLWDLCTKSSLLRVREPDGSMTALPYQCFLAHDLPVRHLSFCPASRNLMVTAGEDRYIKTWDLSRLCEPITVQKRYVCTEVCWALYAPGLLVAEETAYAAYSSHGMHFYDHYMNPLFPIPRSGTMWSMAYSDWLNFTATSDSLGEVILSTLPLLTLQLLHNKRTIEKRFPLQFSSMVPFTTTEEETALKENAAADDEGGDRNENAAPLCPKQDTYQDTVEKCYLQLSDFNLRTFMNFEKRPMWNRMRAVEQRTPLKLDDFPLTALHKVRFSPNWSSHTWLASAGQSGLVRLFCVRCVNYKTSSSSSSSAQDPHEAQRSPESGPEKSSEPGHTDCALPL